MSAEVQHIELPTVSLFVGKRAAVTTRKEVYSGPRPVVEKLKSGGQVALWGAANDFPQRVIADKRKTALVAAVIERKVNLLISGGLRYGKVLVDEHTGFERLIPTRDKAVEKFFRDINLGVFLKEAANDWYTFYNVFCEFAMGRAYDRVVGMGTQNAGHVRLGTMDDKGNIDRCYIADWTNTGETSSAFALPALDPYRNVAAQLLENKYPRAVLPIRTLVDDQFYYGIAPWDGLRANGTIDIANRIMELKKLIMDHISHIRYHIEVDERYWEKVIPDFAKKETADKIAAMKTHVDKIEDWLTGDGQGGVFMTGMLAHGGTTDQTSLVRINEKRMSTPDGAYIEDTQETHFIICRDMGLKPSIHGISPSKSGSSPGSGSEDRVARTNHVLDCKSDQDMILEPFRVVRDVNGWDPEYEFWFGNYYAATLDRTNQVDGKPNAGQER